jgi:hypothetical protein
MASSIAQICCAQVSLVLVLLEVLGWVVGVVTGTFALGGVVVLLVQMVKLVLLVFFRQLRAMCPWSRHLKHGPSLAS